MRILFLFTIAFVVAVMGFAIYTEFSTRQFAKDLPKMSVEKSSRQPNLPSLDLGSENIGSEGPTSGLGSAEVEPPDSQRVTFVPQESTAASLNQKAEPPEVPVYDWRNDNEFRPTPSRDPWHQGDMSMKFVDFGKLSEEELLSMAHKSLLKKFGDIPQVRNVIAFDNRPKDIPITIDEAITHTESCLYLWPDEGTRQCLVQLKQLKASGFRAFPPASAY